MAIYSRFRRFSCNFDGLEGSPILLARLLVGFQTFHRHKRMPKHSDSRRLFTGCWPSMRWLVANGFSTLWTVNWATILAGRPNYGVQNKKSFKLLLKKPPECQLAWKVRRASLSSFWNWRNSQILPINNPFSQSQRLEAINPAILLYGFNYTKLR